MKLKRKADLDRITEIITFIRTQVEVSTTGNLLDVNIYAENFYRDFLNEIFKYELENTNFGDQNSAAIDLGDAVNRIAFQVTSSSDLKKSKKTVTTFNKHNLHLKYDKLIILNVTQKKKHTSNLLGDQKKCQIDPSKDVWDTSDILAKIANRTVPEIEEIRKFLDDQIQFPVKETVSKEIRTFQSLMELLSDEEHPSVGSGYIDEPDPEGKIETRFSYHSDYLKSEFMELFVEYGSVLSDVRKHSDIGSVRLRRLRMYLKKHSDNVLLQFSGDAKAALEAIVLDFKNLIVKAGVDYDEMAIRFFLLDELIRCNVFPNKETVYV